MYLLTHSPASKLLYVQKGHINIDTPKILTNSRPVYSLILSFHLFLCMTCLLPPFTVLCKMVLARPDEWETWPYNCSLCVFSMVRGLRVVRLPAGSSSLVTWSLYEMRSFFLFFCSSAVRVHDSQANRKMDVTRERTSRILDWDKCSCRSKLNKIKQVHRNRFIHQRFIRIQKTKDLFTRSRKVSHSQVTQEKRPESPTIS